MAEKSSADVLLTIEKLNKNFGKKLALNSINLQIKKGEIFGVIGMSGSGKSVFLKTIANFYKPNSGKITYKDINHNHLSFKKFFGFSTQESCFYPELTTKENLTHYGRLYGIEKKILNERIKELLKLLELEEAENVISSTLSGGMQKRLDIACAMIHHPKLLLLDEPTVELDPILRHGVMKLIERINQEEGITIIIASHLLGGIESLCHNIAILHRGELLESGSLKKLREEYGNNGELFLKLAADDKKLLSDLSRYKERMGVTRIVDHGHQCFTLYTNDTTKIMRYLMPLLKSLNEKVIELRISRPSLTEIFTSVVAKKRKTIGK
ncbi:MAG: ABC transporter ATP-binding protein [archaeon]